MSEILVWLEANETVMSAIAAAVVVFSIVGAAMRGALKKTSIAVADTARSTREVLSRAKTPTVDVSQPVPGFGGRPAIAVLPFDNMSEDPGQDYFADGITEDILTSLQSFRTFPVIARNSTFAYKGKSLDLREVAKELGAGYILEGSVRKSGGKVRITGQLIDADGHHLWADRYDRDLSDIFEVQDEITSTIVGAIAPEIDSTEIRLLQSKPTENMDAWDCVLRAQSLIHDSSAESLKDACALLDQATQLDPAFAQAYAVRGNAAIGDYTRFEGRILSSGPRQALNSAAEFATKALSIDRSLPHAYGILGIAHTFLHQYELGLKEAQEAVRLNPSDPLMINVLANALAMSDDFDAAMEYVNVGKRLSPGDPGIGRFLQLEASILYATGRFEEAELPIMEAIGSRPKNPAPRFLLIANLDALGRPDEARLAFEELRRIAPQSSPHFMVEFFARWQDLSQNIRDALLHAGWEG